RAEVFVDPDHPNIEAAFEVPGIKSSDLSIFVQGAILMIQGHRTIKRSRLPSMSPSRPVGLGVEEFNYGKFYRAVRLPAGTTAASVRAGLSDGVLTVTWPR
ncbi:HSP20-like chaperone, partial [Mycena sp. CBHHK59/15]